FGYGIGAYGTLLASGLLHGLNVVAVAVIALAVWSMGRTLAPDRPRMTIAILAGAIAGFLLFKADPAGDIKATPTRVGRRTAVASLVLFFLLLGALPIIAGLSTNHALQLFDRFYRTGSLVFGGGHVVLPLLQSAVVPPGWVTNDAFLAGYGAAQAVPGPLFTFAAYLGTVMTPGPNGWLGAILCLVAIYLPTFLLVSGAVPFWDYARAHPALRSALVGVNAAVVGLLLAALYRPGWTSAVAGTGDFMLVLGAFLLLAFWRTPPWLVVILTAIGGWLVVVVESRAMGRLTAIEAEGAGVPSIRRELRRPARVDVS